MRTLLAVCLVVALVGGGVAFVLFDDRPPAPAAAEAGGPRVRLAVLVVFDQMRGDYLEKWKPLFGAGGFARLQTDGAWFANCHYPYACTVTGPGHASMLTGTCPDRHGIVNNEWYESGAKAYCAGSTRYEFVPPPPPRDPKTAAPTVGNPDRLTAETVADVLRAEKPGAKIFGLSLKDRSAILTTGKRPDGAYWFTGRFVTSTYYDDHLQPWVEEFNASKAADRWFGQKWERFRPDLDYAAWSGPDDVKGEGRGTGQGRTFPHPLTGGKEKIGKEYYNALANSPFGNELVWELAEKCILAEELGKDGVPDLLVVSFSSNDLIGHTWGPDSQEVLDVTLRSDELMARVLTFLDEHVGEGHYALAVTADHGVCPLVDVSQARGIPARRVDLSVLRNELEKHLAATFGTPGGTKSAWVETIAAPWVHVNRKVAAAMNKPVEEVARAAADYLAKRPDVARAFTRADLAAPFPPDDALGNRVRRALYLPPPGAAERCGDVYVVLPEYALPGKVTDTGTTHGAPYSYDTHVPLLVYGPGVAGGTRHEPTTPQATAAIFSRFLDVRLPDKADFPVPATLEPSP